MDNKTKEIQERVRRELTRQKAVEIAEYTLGLEKEQARTQAAKVMRGVTVGEEE